MLGQRARLEWLLRHLEGNRNPRTVDLRVGNALVLPGDLEANWNTGAKPGPPAAALPTNTLEADAYILAIRVGINRAEARASDP